MAYGYSDPYGPHSHGPLSSGPRPAGCRHVPPPAPRHSCCHTQTVYVPVSRPVAPPPRPVPPPRPPRPRYYSPSYTAGSVLVTGAAMAAGQVIGQAVAQSVVNTAANNTVVNNGNTFGTARSMVPGNYPKYCGNCGATTTGARMCEYCGGYLY